MNYKNISIGPLIKRRAVELLLEPDRICDFMKCDIESMQKMYEVDEMSTGLLLRWCKILDYDFFRLYSHHLTLYSPPENGKKILRDNKKSSLPKFRKNIYSNEIINFIMELIENNIKTKNKIIEEYRIPKATLYKWIQKRKEI